MIEKAIDIADSGLYRCTHALTVRRLETQMITLHEGTLAAPDLSRFLPPEDAPGYEAPSFDSDDVMDLAKHLGASPAQLLDLSAMLDSIIDGVRQQDRHEAMLQRVVAVSRALELAASSARGVA